MLRWSPLFVGEGSRETYSNCIMRTVRSNTISVRVVMIDILFQMKKGSRQVACNVTIATSNRFITTSTYPLLHDKKIPPTAYVSLYILFRKQMRLAYRIMNYESKRETKLPPFNTHVSLRVIPYMLLAHSLQIGNTHKHALNIIHMLWSVMYMLWPQFYVYSLQMSQHPTREEPLHNKLRNNNT